ncbi:MAG: GGDEF domain-containing protein [Clostridia bacterium]|nr:GGDEF domain-containing protein [Clostridia bacterium]
MEKMEDKALQKTISFVKSARKKGKTNQEVRLPILFICNQNEIVSYELKGRQMIGRPYGMNQPAIPILNEYVSRQHGYFESEGKQVRYTAQKTTNGILFKGRQLPPGTSIVLEDGDELQIPIYGSNDTSCILLNVVTEYEHVQFWTNLSKLSKDDLTGLLTRKGFNARLLQKIQEMDDTSTMCVFILDVDGFKQVNDRHGHLAGDMVLKMVSGQMEESVGKSGLVCRWGGDEFIGAIEGRPRMMRNLMEQLRSRIASTAVEDGIQVTVSIGYVTIRKDQAVDMDKIIESADRALYRAKNEGKNRIIMNSDVG